MLHVAGGPNNSNNVSPEYVCVSRAFKHEPLAALKHNVAALHWKINNFSKALESLWLMHFCHVEWHFTRAPS